MQHAYQPNKQSIERKRTLVLRVNFYEMTHYSLVFKPCMLSYIILNYLPEHLSTFEQILNIFGGYTLLLMNN